MVLPLASAIAVHVGFLVELLTFFADHNLNSLLMLIVRTIGFVRRLNYSGFIFERLQHSDFFCKLLLLIQNSTLHTLVKELQIYPTFTKFGNIDRIQPTLLN